MPQDFLIASIVRSQHFNLLLVLVLVTLVSLVLLLILLSELFAFLVLSVNIPINQQSLLVLPVSLVHIRL